MHYQYKVITTCATVVFLFSFAHGVTATGGSYTETFTSTKYLDAAHTSGQWDTADHQALLKNTYSMKTWETSMGFPDLNVTAGRSAKTSWLVGGANGRVVKSVNGKFTDLPNLLPGFTGAVTAIGYNDHYWLLGGNAQLWKYDGTTATDISTAFAASFGNQYVRDIEWNGTYWLIMGAGGSIVRYDGTTFTALMGTLQFSGSEMYGAWNGSQWFLVAPSGQVMLYDGTTATTVQSPFSSGWLKVAAGYHHAWVVYGFVPSAMVLSTFDGTTFHDVSSLIVKAGGSKTATKINPAEWTFGNVVWDGVSWTVTLSPHDSTKNARIFRVNKTWTSAKEISYKGTGIYSFYSNASGATSTGWVMFGNKVANNVPSPFAVAGTYIYDASDTIQSKPLPLQNAAIKKVTLTATATKPKGTTVTFSVSNDKGVHWVTAKSGKKVTFTTKGTKLVWRAILTTNKHQESPIIKQVKIDYQ